MRDDCTFNSEGVYFNNLQNTHSKIRNVKDQHSCFRGPVLCSGAVETHSSPTSEVSGSNPRPCVGKLVVAYRCSAVFSTEP